MAAFVKAVNAKIRANPVLNYVCSTRTCFLSLFSVFDFFLLASFLDFF